MPPTRTPLSIHDLAVRLPKLRTGCQYLEGHTDLSDKVASMAIASTLVVLLIAEGAMEP